MTAVKTSQGTVVSSTTEYQKIDSTLASAAFVTSTSLFVESEFSTQFVTIYQNYTVTQSQAILLDRIVLSGRFQIWMWRYQLGNQCRGRKVRWYERRMRAQFLGDKVSVLVTRGMCYYWFRKRNRLVGREDTASHSYTLG